MYNTILHATDLTANHFSISQKAATIAEKFNANIYLIHVIQPPAILQLAQGLGFAEFDRPVKNEAESVIQTLGEALNIPLEQLYIEIGSIKHEILSKAISLGVDLIIIGSHAPSNMPFTLGGTAYSIVHGAQCDVLTLRANN